MFTVEIIFAGLLLFHTDGTCTSYEPSREAVSVLFVGTSDEAPACLRPKCSHGNPVQCDDGNAPKCSGSMNVCQDGGVSLVCENGLLKCTNGNAICGDGALVCGTPQSQCTALDNSTIPKHRSVLVFYTDQVEAANRSYSIDLGTGRSLGIYHLDGECLELVTPASGGVQCLPGYDKKVDRSPNPHNQRAFGWLAGIGHFDHAVTGLRNELKNDDPPQWNARIAAKLKLDEGSLGSRAFQTQDSVPVRWMACPDMRKNGGVPSEGEKGYGIARSLPEQVVFHQGPLEITDRISLQTCGGEELFRFKPVEGKVKLRFSNLPSSLEGPGEPMSHFKWYYELMTCTDDCRHPLPVPKEAASLFEDHDYSCGTGGNGQLCPPTTYP